MRKLLFSLVLLALPACASDAEWNASMPDTPRSVRCGYVAGFYRCGPRPPDPVRITPARPD